MTERRCGLCGQELCAEHERNYLHGESTLLEGQRNNARDLVVEVIEHYAGSGPRPAWEDRPGNEWLRTALSAVARRESMPREDA